MKLFMKVEKSDGIAMLKAHGANFRKGFQPYLTDVADIIDETNAYQVEFGKGEAFGGKKWAPMKKSTVAGGRDPATLLVKTGRLLGALTSGSFHIRRLSAYEVETGTRVPPRKGGGDLAKILSTDDLRPGRGGSIRRKARVVMQKYNFQGPLFLQLLADFIRRRGKYAGL